MTKFLFIVAAFLFCLGFWFKFKHDALRGSGRVTEILENKSYKKLCYGLAIIFILIGILYQIL